MPWLLPFKRYVQFSGRAGRAEFWQYLLAVLALALVALALDYAQNPYGSPTLALLLLLGTTLPTYAVAVRRLHDRNQSGWLIGSVWIADGVVQTVARSRQTETACTGLEHRGSETPYRSSRI